MTSAEFPVHCERCGNALHGASMSPKEFKERFKPGDVVLGWSTRKPCLITAIGEERILYRDLHGEGFRNKTIERVAKIRQQFIWEKQK